MYSERQEAAASSFAGLGASLGGNVLTDILGRAFGPEKTPAPENPVKSPSPEDADFWASDDDQFASFLESLDTDPASEPASDPASDLASDPASVAAAAAEDISPEVTATGDISLEVTTAEYIPLELPGAFSEGSGGVFGLEGVLGLEGVSESGENLGSGGVSILGVEEELLGLPVPSGAGVGEPEGDYTAEGDNSIDEEQRAWVRDVEAVLETAAEPVSVAPLDDVMSAASAAARTELLAVVDGASGASDVSAGAAAGGDTEKHADEAAAALREAAAAKVGADAETATGPAAAGVVFFVTSESPELELATDKADASGGSGEQP